MLEGLDPTGRLLLVCERLNIGTALCFTIFRVAPLALFAALFVASLLRITTGSCSPQGGVPTEITVLIALTSGLMSLILWGTVISGYELPWMDDETCAGGLLVIVLCFAVICFVIIAPILAVGLARSYQCDPGTIAIAATLAGAVYGLPFAKCLGDCLWWPTPEASAPPELTVAQQLEAAARAAALPYHTAGPRPPSGRVAKALVLRFSAALCGGKSVACTDCAICSEAFNEGEGVACLSCGGDLTLVRAHVFHRECLAEWFRRHCTCPLCRAELPVVEVAKVIGRKAPGGVGPPPVVLEAVGPAASSVAGPASFAGNGYPFI